MSILLNAEALQALAQIAPELRDALACAPLTQEQTRALHVLLEELSPISTDLLIAARHLRHSLEALGT